MTSPLQGIRVLELGQFIAGPFVGLQLADLGAEVVKVEKPGEGEPFRGFAGAASAGYSYSFCAYNRNKQSLTIDLGQKRGQELLRRIVPKFDVVTENFRPGVTKRLGIDWPALSAVNPRLVYCTITGFTDDGPYGALPAYDAVGQALSGITHMFTDPADPRMRGPTIADQVSGMQACNGVLGALFQRERTGKGARVEITLLEASIYFTPDSFSAYTQEGLALESETRASRSLAFVFACTDGLIAMQPSSVEKFWQGLIAAVERPDIGEDPRFKLRPDRIKNFPALVQVLRPVFATRSRADWIARLTKTGVPAAQANTIPETLADPEVKHLGLFHTLEHPEKGKVTAMRRGVRIDGTREDAPKPPPALGEHTDRILADAGIAKDEIAELHKAGIV